MNGLRIRDNDNDRYCYPNTNVLINKLNIRDQSTLSEVERSITLIRTLEVDEMSTDVQFDLDHLRAIHNILFHDIYEWAGEIRTVDISKRTMFCKCEYIVDNANRLFNELNNDGNLRDRPCDYVVFRIAYYLCEINAIHPFREGNGRAQRAFMRQVARSAGYTLDFTGISDKEMMDASVYGFTKNYYEKL